MTAEAINDLATIPLLLGSVFALASTLTYGLTARWWDSWLGVAFLGIMVAASIVAAVPALRRMLGAYPGYEYVSNLLYWLHAGAWIVLFLVILHEQRRKPVVLSFDRKVPTMSTPTAPRPAFPWKRAARSTFGALVVGVPIANGVAIALVQYLTEQTSVVVPGWAFLVLNGVVAGTSLVIGGVARIMAVPGVNDLLTRIGLGAVPKAVADAGTVGRADPANVEARDLKA